MLRPSRRKRRTPTCFSSCRMRVVTFDWTRLSLAAARTTPPSSTTVWNILRDSRSIVLMQRTIVHFYSFEQAGAARHRRCMARVVSTSRLASVAGTCFVASGRVAVRPMLALMVRDGLIPPDAGAWLAASNYLGYLAGALVAGRIPLSSPSLMGISLVGTAAVTAAIGVLDGLAFWLLLRFT